MTLAKAQIGDVVTRNRRFTESFVEGEEHTVQRVSGCGHYIWVGGHRHKVPVKYFNLVRRKPSVVPEPPVLTDFSEPNFTAAPANANGEDCGRLVGDNPHGCGLVAKTEPVETPAQYTARTGYRKFKVGDNVVQRDGSREFEVHSISHCGYRFRAHMRLSLGWLNMHDFELKTESTVNRDIVAGLILQGVNVQYRNLGEWFDVNPSTLTVSMIGRLDFRVKPLTMDYYGNEVPATVDVNTTKVKTVWGISLNNNKIYPCALGTARVNKSKGHGLYWETEAQAQQVFDILMKPFNGATK